MAHAVLAAVSEGPYAGTGRGTPFRWFVFCLGARYSPASSARASQRTGHPIRFRRCHRLVSPGGRAAGCHHGSAHFRAGRSQPLDAAAWSGPRPSDPGQRPPRAGAVHLSDRPGANEDRDASPQVVMATNRNCSTTQSVCGVPARRTRRGGSSCLLDVLVSNDPDELPLPKRRHMLRVRCADLDPGAGGPAWCSTPGAARSDQRAFRGCGIDPSRVHPGFPAATRTVSLGQRRGSVFRTGRQPLLLGMRIRCWARMH